ncbi:hypothetical protein D3C73_603310 [compost metagenome]
MTVIFERMGLPPLEVSGMIKSPAAYAFLGVHVVSRKQGYPICQNDEFVIRKGKNNLRNVRHLPAFAKKNVLCDAHDSDALFVM